MNSHVTTMPSQRRLFAKSVLAGLAITIATYLSAWACAAAQWNSMVVVLLWPSFLITGLLPPSEPVTCCSQSGVWLPLATAGAAWLFYAGVCYFWISRRSRKVGYSQASRT